MLLEVVEDAKMGAKTVLRSQPLITENFLLQSKAAVRLYHEYAAGMPILDYHNHLPPREIAGDRRFENLTQMWLAGDHYKWRAMRTCGVAEHFITGPASDWEKFEKWAEVVPSTLRNPLYHWTHMELAFPFGISDRLLNPGTARGIWENANAQLAKPEFSVRGLLKQWKVVLVCTTDDPTDDLAHHREFADVKAGVSMVPAFRPDAVLAMEEPAAWNAWVDRLSAAADVDIRDWTSLLNALARRCDFFHACGCRLSDHGLERLPAAGLSEHDAAIAIARLRSGETLGSEAIRGVRLALLLELGRMYHAHGWTQQFHVGALRNVSSALEKRVGRDSGGDTIGDFPQAQSLARFLDRLEREDALAKTILYNLNPADNEVMGAMIGNFQDARVPGKIQYGSAWWFLDQKSGMERQLDALSSLGLLSRFVGMLTDSRSFLSFSRHEYFRRILCNVLGTDIEQGLMPRDFDLIGGLVKDVCYRNAAGYFGFNVPN